MRTLERLLAPVVLGLAFAPLLASWVGAQAPLAAPSAFVVEEPETVSMFKLANVEYRKGKKLPKDIRALNGKQVKLRGYMMLDTPEGDRSFLMSYEACNCSTTTVQHFVDVTLPGEQTTTFAPDIIEVTGTFEVGEVYDEDGFVKSVYRLKAATYKVE